MQPSGETRPLFARIIVRSCAAACLALFLGCAAPPWGFELTCERMDPGGDGPSATVDLMYRPDVLARRPVVMLMGTLEPDKPPEWALGLLEEGYMLAAYSVAHPPDPDPARRPEWLVFDERFAHGYTVGAMHAPTDASRVVRFLSAREDVDKKKIGFLGSSSSGILGLAAATQGPRFAAVVAFVSTGAYRLWFDTWKPNGLWRGKGDKLWPETLKSLHYDPVQHTDKLFPTALLLVSGGNDKVVDPKTARAFADALRPHYRSDPERLRLVVYEGYGHNLPADVVRLYAEHWFRSYMHPVRAQPLPKSQVLDLKESARRTQLGAGDPKSALGAK